MDSREELFHQYRYVAGQVARAHSRRYNVPVTEANDHADFALALLLYEQAESYKPEKGTVEAWLRFKITMHLRDVHLRGYHPHCPDVKEHKCYDQVMVDTHLLQTLDEVTELKRLRSRPNPTPSWVDRFLREASEEASALLEIIWDAPQDLLAEICPKPGRRPSDKRLNLIHYLVDVLDWSEERVRSAFQEVEACLCR